MSLKQLRGLCFWLVATAASHAAEPVRRPVPPTEPVPTIEMDDSSRYRSNRVQFAAELSMVTPTLVQQNGNTQFEKTTGIPVISLAAKLPLFRMGGFQFLAEAKAGFGTSNGTFLVSSASSRYYETARALWIPAALSFESTYEMPGVPFIKPALAVGAGGQYLSQRTEGGVTRNLITPMLTLHPYLLFLQNSDPNGWFGGFTFGLTRTWGIGPNRVNASAIDMAFLFNL